MTSMHPFLWYRFLQAAEANQASLASISQQQPWVRARGPAAAPTSTVSAGGTYSSSSVSFFSALRAMVYMRGCVCVWGGGGTPVATSLPSQSTGLATKMPGTPRAWNAASTLRSSLADVSKCGRPPLAAHHCLAFFSLTCRACPPSTSTLLPSTTKGKFSESGGLACVQGR